MDSMRYRLREVSEPTLVEVQPHSNVERGLDGCVTIKTRMERLIFIAGLMCVVCIVLFNVITFSGIHWVESLPYSDYLLYTMGTWKYCHVSYSMDDEESYICMILQGIFAALENKEWFLGAQVLSVLVLVFVMINVVLQNNAPRNSVFSLCKILPERFAVYFICGLMFLTAVVQLVMLTAFWRDGLDVEELSLMLHYSDYLSYSILLIFVTALLSSITVFLLIKQFKTIVKPKMEELAQVSVPGYSKLDANMSNMKSLSKRVRLA